MAGDGAGKKLWGYYPTTKVWVPLQVDENGKVVVDMSAATHAASHQNGGADEVSVAALSGLLADDQHVLDAEVLAVAAALVHAARHQNGGADEISVAALSGLLADDQHVLDAEVLAVAAALVHAARHQNGGADEISLAGLSGEPADVIAKSLLTTQGDIITRNGSIPKRLALGTEGYYLRAGATEPAWAALTAPSRASAYLDTAQTLYGGVWSTVILNNEEWDELGEFDDTLKQGTATATSGAHLIDTTLNPFTAADVGAHVYNATDHTYAYVTAYTSASDVTLNTPRFVSGEAYKLYRSRFTASVAGYYIVSGSVRYNSATRAHYWTAFFKNGAAEAMVYNSGEAAAGGPHMGFVSVVIHMEADDYLELGAYQNLGFVALQATRGQTFMSVHRLS